MFVLVGIVILLVAQLLIGRLLGFFSIYNSIRKHSWDYMVESMDIRTLFKARMSWWYPLQLNCKHLGWFDLKSPMYPIGWLGAKLCSIIGMMRSSGSDLVFHKWPKCNKFRSSTSPIGHYGNQDSILLLVKSKPRLLINQSVPHMLTQDKNITLSLLPRYYIAT